MWLNISLQTGTLFFKIDYPQSVIKHVVHMGMWLFRVPSPSCISFSFLIFFLTFFQKVDHNTQENKNIHKKTDAPNGKFNKQTRGNQRSNQDGKTFTSNKRNDTDKTQRSKPFRNDERNQRSGDRKKPSQPNQNQSQWKDKQQAPTVVRSTPTEWNTTQNTRPVGTTNTSTNEWDARKKNVNDDWSSQVKSGTNDWDNVNNTTSSSTTSTTSTSKDTFFWGSSTVKPVPTENLNDTLTDSFQNLSVNTNTEKEESSQPRVILPKYEEEKPTARVVLPSLSSNDDIDVQFGGKIVSQPQQVKEKLEEPAPQKPVQTTVPQSQQNQIQPPPQTHSPHHPQMINPTEPISHGMYNNYSKVIPMQGNPLGNAPNTPPMPFIPPWGSYEYPYGQMNMTHNYSFPPHMGGNMDYVNNTGNTDYIRGNESLSNQNRVNNYQEKPQMGYMNPGPNSNAPYPTYYYPSFHQNYGQNQYMRYPGYSDGMNPPNQYPDTSNQH